MWVKFLPKASEAQWDATGPDETENWHSPSQARWNSDYHPPSLLPRELVYIVLQRVWPRQTNGQCLTSACVHQSIFEERMRLRMVAGVGAPAIAVKSIGCKA